MILYSIFYMIPYFSDKRYNQTKIRIIETDSILTDKKNRNFNE